MTAIEQQPLNFHPRLSDFEEDRGDDPSAVFRLFREIANPRIVAYFTVDGEPASKARARWNGAKSSSPHTPEATRKAEELVGWQYRKTVGPHKTTADQDFGVCAIFFCTTHQRRDVDNMLKLVLDGLTKVAWNDDSQVTEVAGRVARGCPAGHARTEVLIYSVPSTQRAVNHCEQCGKPYRYYPSQDARRFCTKKCEYQHRIDKNRRKGARRGRL